MEAQRRTKHEQTSESESDTSAGTRARRPHAQEEAVFSERVDGAARAIKRGDYVQAASLYSAALELDPGNHLLLSNRSAMHVKAGQYEQALQDARAAKQLRPQWCKVYLREAVALQCLNREAEAMASYATGLVHDSKNKQLLQGLVTAAKQSSIKHKFGVIYAQLERMSLSDSSFVVISVVGQELLSAGVYACALTLLESALRIGTCSLKLRGSVFSALSSAHWALGNIDKAIACMQQDLAVAKSLGDQDGECRAYGNLGAAYFHKGSYKEAIAWHRQQLLLAMRHKDLVLAASVLSHLGHDYTALSDYPNALASHLQSVRLTKQAAVSRLHEAREIGNVGAVYLAMDECNKALECHREHLNIARDLGDKHEEARAYSNLGSTYHFTRDYTRAIEYHSQVLNIAKEISDRTLEARAYAGLGHACRCMQNWAQAKYYHEQQLNNALQTRDKVAEGRSCSNLGIIYHQLGEYEAALKLHKAHLKIAKDLGDRASQGRAYGNIGNAYSVLEEYEVAIRFHKQELSISKEVGDKHSECSTHGNLAVAYQALQIDDKALSHYEAHLHMSQQLKDTQSETRALSNLANYHSAIKNYIKAIPLYEQYLALSQEIQDTEGEGKACHKLGYVHYCLGNYREAIRYYEQDLALAKDLQDKSSMCRAYCNLGLAHKALGDYKSSLECQKYFLATAHMTKSLSAKFVALGNIGDVLLKLDDIDEAIQMFNQQLQIAKQCKERKLEATAYGNLGAAHRTLKQLDKALAYHNQELTIYQELNETKGECKAHGHLGNVHMSLGNYSHALRCYEEMLERGRELKDVSVEAHACGNLGLAHINLGHFDEALGYFEQQLALLEQFNTYQTKLDRGRACANLGDCYESLGDFEEAVKYYEQYLAIAQSTNSIVDQDKAYRGLGNAHKALGNLQQALVCFEKRLYVTHELERPGAKCSAYGELGCLHSLLGNFEQAISCLQHQLNTAREMGDSCAEGEAMCGLGGVYQQMGEFDKALQYHEGDLSLALETQNIHSQCRAHGNLGLSHESLGEYEHAIGYQEQHLSIATQMNDHIAKTLALSSLGRVHHAMSHYEQATHYLSEGLALAEQYARREDEAKIRHRLGLALWGHGDLEAAQGQLYKATDLFESIRREAQLNNDYKLSMFDLQTASYQVLQRVLVSLGRHEEALVVAERGRTRAFVDFLLERQKSDAHGWYQSLDATPVTKESILETVAKQQACVLYYSLAAGYLYTWLITPDKGLVRFEQSSIGELECGSDPEDTQSVRSLRSMGGVSLNGSVLDGVIGHVRESLGVETQLTPSRSARTSLVMSETESEADDLWQQHVDQLHDKLNAQSDRTGFLRMLSRNHVTNVSSYSLSSLLSLGSGSLAGIRAGSTRSVKSSLSGLSQYSTGSGNFGGSSGGLSGKAPLAALYELLIAPMEKSLRRPDHRQRDLVLVLQGDLYLIPFALLRKSQTQPPLYERFHLIAVPSVRALQASITLNRQQRAKRESSGALAIGNPRLPGSVQDQWQWGPLAAAERECGIVGELLSGQAITGAQATKDSVLQMMAQPEVLHFATHVSWKLAALVLSSQHDFSTTSSVHATLERMDLNESQSAAEMSGPSLSEFLLTAADILNTQLQAKLVVLSSGHSEDRAGRINSDGVVGLTRAFLAAGAQCVLFSLWPVPELASRVFLKAFYSSMLQGAKTSQALSEAMRAVQASKKWTHASNWASWVLIGSDVKLSSKGALMGRALCQLLQTPSSAREAMRVVLHLVEKSLQRMRHQQRSAMYTTLESVQNKMGDVNGWKDLLAAVGFRFEPVNGHPAVFFPTSDPGDRLTQCSATMQALLGLAVPTLTALAKISEHYEMGEALSTLVRDVHAKYVAGEATIQMPVSVQLWKAPGCHEFLASLGFDLVEVKSSEVTIKAGKQANRRMLNFALQALLAIFDTQDGAGTLLLDSSSSLESLATSTSAFSKGSTSPTSPAQPGSKSFFNPAEVHKLPSATNRSSVRSTSSKASRVATHSTGSVQSRHKYNTEEERRLDARDEDDSSVCSHTGVPASRPTGGLYHQPPRHPYSTSASDSEADHTEAGNNLYMSKALSHSRGSLASQSSTMTNKSTASGSSGFRRTKFRGSAASTRSTGSDRTITNESEGRSESRERRSESRNSSASRVSISGESRPMTSSSRSSSANRVNATRESRRDQFSATTAVDIAKINTNPETIDSETSGGKNLTDTVSKGVVAMKKLNLHDSGIDSQISQASQASPPQGHHYVPGRNALGDPAHADEDSNLSGTWTSSELEQRHQYAPSNDPPKLSQPQSTNAQSIGDENSALSNKPVVPSKPNSISARNTNALRVNVNLSANSQANKPSDTKEWYDDTAEDSCMENAIINTTNAPTKLSSVSAMIAKLNNNDSRNQTPSLFKPPTPRNATESANFPLSPTTATSLVPIINSSTESLVSGVGKQSSLDPTAVAQRVMMDTFGHKKSLDAMQHWSMRNLQKKRTQSEQDDLESLDAALNAPVTPASGTTLSQSEQSTRSDVMGGRNDVLGGGNDVMGGGNDVMSAESDVIDVSSTLSDSSIERVKQTPVTNNTGGNATSSSMGNPPPPPYPGLPARPASRQPIMANSLSDANSSYTIGGGMSRPMAPPNTTATTPMEMQQPMGRYSGDGGPISSSASSGMPLAPIPENDAAVHASSTDTDYESIQSPIIQPPRPGALKTRNRLIVARQVQKGVRFKDEVDGNLESASEDSFNLSTKSSTELTRIRNAMRRNLASVGRMSDEESMSDSQSDLGSSMHSSGLSSSLSSRDGSLQSPLVGIKSGLNPHLVQYKMQELYAPTGNGGGRGMGLHPHQLPQSPTGSSSGGTATPPYVPHLATPPYRVHGPQRPNVGLQRFHFPTGSGPGFRNPSPRSGAPPALPPRGQGMMQGQGYSNGPMSPTSAAPGFTGEESEMRDVTSQHMTSDSESSQRTSSAPSIPARLPITSILNHKQGKNMQQQEATQFHYTPHQGRFQPMNRTTGPPPPPPQQPHHQGLAPPQIQHASSMESLQSYHSFQALHAPGANREWYHSDSEASVYSSAEEHERYRISGAYPGQTRYPGVGQPGLQQQPSNGAVTSQQQQHYMAAPGSMNPGTQMMQQGPRQQLFRAPVTHQNLGSNPGSNPGFRMQGGGANANQGVPRLAFSAPGPRPQLASSVPHQPPPTVTRHVAQPLQPHHVTSQPHQHQQQPQQQNHMIYQQNQHQQNRGSYPQHVTQHNMTSQQQNYPQMTSQQQQMMTSQSQQNYATPQHNHVTSQYNHNMTSSSSQQPQQNTGTINNNATIQYATAPQPEVGAPRPPHSYERAPPDGRGPALSDSREDAWYRDTTDDELESALNKRHGTMQIQNGSGGGGIIGGLPPSYPPAPPPASCGQQRFQQMQPQPSVTSQTSHMTSQSRQSQPPQFVTSSQGLALPNGHHSGGQYTNRAFMSDNGELKNMQNYNRPNMSQQELAKSMANPRVSFDPPGMNYERQGGRADDVITGSDAAAHPLQNEHSMMSKLLGGSQNGGVTPSRGQLMNEQQSRLGLMYADMNLKTSQC